MCVFFLLDLYFFFFFFFFKQKTAYEMLRSLVGSEMCIRDRDALTGVEVVGVTGSISFDEVGDADKDMAFIKTVENGKFKFLMTVSVE